MPRYLLWKVLHEYIVQVVASRNLVLSLHLFMIFMERMLRHSQGWRDDQYEGLHLTSLLFAIYILLAPFELDLLLDSPVCLSAECGVAGTGVHNFKSDGTVLFQKSGMLPSVEGRNLATGGGN